VAFPTDEIMPEIAPIPRRVTFSMDWHPFSKDNQWRRYRRGL